MGEHDCADCDSQDQNPQVDTVLGEEMTIHRNSRLRINVTTKRRNSHQKTFCFVQESGAEALAVLCSPFCDAASHTLAPESPNRRIEQKAISQNNSSVIRSSSEIAIEADHSSPLSSVPSSSSFRKSPVMSSTSFQTSRLT